MRFPRRKPLAEQSPVEDRADWSGPPRLAHRSCCCQARPVAKVLIPPAPGRPHSVDLLLCAHHYQASRAALAAVGAMVIDETGSFAGPVSAGEPRSATSPALGSTT